MADVKNPLPIHTEADADKRVQVKVVDATTVSQQMIVDTDSNAHVEVHGNNPAGGDETLRLSELGAVTPDGVYHATDNSKPGNVGLVAHTRAASPGDSDQGKRLSAITNGSVHALDISLHDEDGASYSESNPLPVYMAQSSGTEIHNVQASSAVAVDASTTHEYTVTAGKTLNLKQIEVSASARAKFLIEIAPDGVTFAHFHKLFVSVANPNGRIIMDVAKEVPAAGKVKITKTNTDEDAQDLYSMIIGVEV